MRIAVKLKPGQRGTKKLLAEYGDRLVCVRYRYDKMQKRRFKTVEIIIDEGSWQRRPRRIKPDEIVGLRVGWRETELQNRIRRSGGKWNAGKKVWEMRYDGVVKIGLEGRIAAPESL